MWCFLSSVDGRSGSVRLLAAVHSAAVNGPVTSSVSTSVFSCVACGSSSGIARSTDFHSGGSLFAFPAAVYGNPNFADLRQNLFFSFCSVLLILAIPLGAKRYLTASLIYVSLMANEAGHLFTCLLAVRTSVLEACPFKPFALLFVKWGCLSFRHWVVRVLYAFWKRQHYQIYESVVCRCFSILRAVLSLSPQRPSMHKSLSLGGHSCFPPLPFVAALLLSYFVSAA